MARCSIAPSPSIREAALRALGLRPFPVQIMGALAMCEGAIAEMATGEGKTLTASLAASMWAGRPAGSRHHRQRLSRRARRRGNGPGLSHTGPQIGLRHPRNHAARRIEHYRRNVVYCTSKELVADFLRDQIKLGTLRNSTQTTVGA